jgi:hypothetical protein
MPSPLAWTGRAPAAANATRVAPLARTGAERKVRRRIPASVSRAVVAGNCRPRFRTEASAGDASGRAVAGVQTGCPVKDSLRVVHDSGREIKIERAAKVLFPESGITKGELIEYYQQIAGRMLPYPARPAAGNGTVPGRNWQAGVFSKVGAA